MDPKESMQLEPSEENMAVSFKARELKFHVPWGHIAGKAWGDPCGQPVLCVHGFQDNAGTFDRLIPQLPQLLYYVCIDLPGHGQSSHFPCGVPLDFTDYVISLLRVLNSLQWDTCYLLGHSFGAVLGVFLSSLWPERVKKLIVLDGIALNTLEIRQHPSHLREIIDKVLMSEEKFSEQNSPSYSYEEALGRVLSNRRSTITRESAKVLMKRSLAKNEDGGYRFTTDQRLKVGLPPLLNADQHYQIQNNVKCPILALLSDLPKIAKIWKPGREALKLFGTKNNFQRIDVEGHHDVHLDNPERIAPHISKFLITQTCSL